MNHCEICGEDAVAGLGAAPTTRWLCINHFETALAEIKKLMSL